MTLDPTLFKIQPTLGYLQRKVLNPVTGRLGWVFEHILVAEALLGRKLADDEEVHHLNLNRLDNSPDNIIVLHKTMHRKLHGWINQGCPIVSKAYGKVSDRRCSVCLSPLTSAQRTTCSVVCKKKNQASTIRPDRATLIAQLLNLGSFTAVGQVYQVSGKSIRKWADTFGLTESELPVRNCGGRTPRAALSSVQS